MGFSPAIRLVTRMKYKYGVQPCYVAGDKDEVQNINMGFSPAISGDMVFKGRTYYILVACQIAGLNPLFVLHPCYQADSRAEPYICTSSLAGSKAEPHICTSSLPLDSRAEPNISSLSQLVGDKDQVQIWGSALLSSGKDEVQI